MKVICPDGGGNYLIYSVALGKFYDYFHEEDIGSNYKNWLKTGVSYKDFMNHIVGSKQDQNKIERYEIKFISLNLLWLGFTPEFWGGNLVK